MPRFVKRMLWALGVSLAIHVALLLGPHISLPDSFAPAATLEARIEAPPPRPKPIPKKPRPAKPKPRKAAPAKPAAQPSAPAAQNGSAEAKPKQAPQPPTEPENPVAEPPPPMPRHAKIQFIIYKGLDGLAVGRATQTWDSDGHTYTLSQVAEASGLFSLFVSGKHVQESRGEITTAGLHPLSFRTERGSRAPEKIDTAQFDWPGNRLNLVSGGEARTADLPADAQDQLSFIYQLAWAPPEDGVRLHITSGRKIDTYTYMAVGEETLDTPLGPLKTLHISRHRNSGEEGTDIWLAEDYHYLPVKVRLTDKNGDSAEQVVSKIQVTEQE